MRTISVITAVLLTVLIAGVTFVWAFNPPTQAPPGGNGAIAVDINNNVGIGTTSPSQKFEVFEGNVFINDSSNSAYGIRWARNGTLIGLIDTSNAVLSIQAQNNKRIDLKDDAGNYGIAIADGGNVGIGATPSYMLDVYKSYTDFGSQFLQRNRAVTAVTANSANYLLAMDVDATDSSISSSITDSGYRVGMRSQAYTNTINFQGTLARQYGIWSRAGIHNAGTGGTVTNAYGVYGEILNDDTDGTITNSYAGYFRNNGTTGTINNRYGIYVLTGSSGINYFDGKVGIGTNDPTASLHLSASGAGIKLNDTTGSNPYFTFLANGTRKGMIQYAADLIQIGGDNSVGIAFMTNGIGGANERMRIDADGNVGIGTVAPSSPSPNGTTSGNLDVNDVYIRERGAWASQLVTGLDLNACAWSDYMAQDGGGMLTCPPGQVMTGLVTNEHRVKTSDRRTYFAILCCPFK